MAALVASAAMRAVYVEEELKSDTTSIVIVLEVALVCIKATLLLVYRATMGSRCQKMLREEASSHVEPLPLVDRGTVESRYRKILLPLGVFNHAELLLLVDRGILESRCQKILLPLGASSHVEPLPLVDRGTLESRYRKILLPLGAFNHAQEPVLLAYRAIMESKCRKMLREEAFDHVEPLPLVDRGTMESRCQKNLLPLGVFNHVQQPLPSAEATMESKYRLMLQELADTEVMVLVDVIWVLDMCIMGQDNSEVHELFVTKKEEAAAEATIYLHETVAV